MAELSASYFDDWYSASLASPHDGRSSRFLQLPEGVCSNSSLPGPGLDDVVRELESISGGHVVDLGCGRGHLSVEIARRVGCRVTGIDFSRIAIEAARRRGASAAVDAAFQVADMRSTGLPDHCADAVVSIDAMYFPRPLSAVTAECGRLLRGGGRLIATGWEPVDREPRLPAALQAAGFINVRVHDRPAWSAIERERWIGLLEVSNSTGDPSLAADQTEATSVLAEFDQRRRVMVTAVTVPRSL
ncbi:MAG TPA: class I SAM-dependent methyltransferase [Blastococcus sp.]|nr:class I SAM-dependent methyltransferase [Blastococcus sp.]